MLLYSLLERCYADRMFNLPDLKWFIDFLKVGPWKTASLSLAAGILLFANSKRTLPVTLQPLLLVLVLVCVFCACLAISSLVELFAVPAISREWKIWRLQRRIPEMIKTMDPKEKEILGYLLANNLKGFRYAADGGYASSLIAKGLIVCTAFPGQRCNGWEVPFEIPDYVWKVLVRHKSQFDFTDRGGPFPWAIHWSVR
jgi:Super-infection exclusion protein B